MRTPQDTEPSPLSSRDKWSYILIAEELRRFSSEPVKDARELFRRMVFNALITNAHDIKDLSPCAFLSLSSSLVVICFNLSPFRSGTFQDKQNLALCLSTFTGIKKS